MSEHEELDELTKHLNHQIVTPLAGLATSIRLLLNSLKHVIQIQNEKVLNPERYLELIEILQPESNSILKIANEIQEVRESFKRGDYKGNSEKILKTIGEVYAAEIERVHKLIRNSFSRNKRFYSLPIREQLDQCRRQASQVIRMLRTVYQSYSNIELNFLSINFSTIFQLASLIVKEGHPERANVIRDKFTIRDLTSGIKFGDYDKLTEVFVNLIDNSLKYSQQKEHLEVNVLVRSSRIKELTKYFGPITTGDIDYLLIEYSDNGQGIKKNERQMIFKKGYQSKGNNYKNEATSIGYGLFYNQLVISAHLGQITYTSSDEFQNKGSFFFYIPRFSTKENFLKIKNRVRVDGIES